MGASISNWRLAQAVSRIGQLGVVSGTSLDGILARRLQNGDPDGCIRRALEHFPFPRMAKRVFDAFFIPGGKSEDAPYKKLPMHTLDSQREPIELCIVGNFVEIFLAREGHSNPVGINYLEKIQLPHLPAIYGALLAGVAVIIMGAGIPLAVPGVISALIEHQPAEYPVFIAGETGGGETVNLQFNPADFIEDIPLPKKLKRPDFLPIVSSETLALVLLRKADGPIDGFIVEGSPAGGHNAPPRGKQMLNEKGELIYSSRDTIDLESFRKLNRPFWLAGSTGSPEGLKKALASGACGIQAGTAFALCEESGLKPDVRRELIRRSLAGESAIFSDPVASPTGFPFKVADFEGSLSENDVYQQRKRICDLGILRQPYRKVDGTIGYRCAAEPIAAYLAKGGLENETIGRKCLCNALIANAGMPQRLADGTDELCLITMGDDLAGIRRFCKPGNLDYSAADVVNTLLGT